jgi:DNA polymerase-4
MSTPQFERCILHVDMDAFFASVEQVDHPEWKNKPVIVGSPPTQRGVVSTCSYEARRFGVHSAMPSRQAFQLCPEGIFVTPRMARYQAISDAVFNIFERFTPTIEALSIDEAFLDVTHVQRLFGTGESIAQQIQQAIYSTHGLTCSIGIAPNKFLAKLASEENKPNGIFSVPSNPSHLLTWLGKKSVRHLWGVGPKLAEQLEAHRLFTVRDIQCCNPQALAEWTTPRLAAHLTDIAFGRDARVVETEREEKSFSREHTYREDILDRTELRKALRWIAEDVGLRLRAHHLWARVGRLKIRYKDFRTVTRQTRFPTPVCDDQALRDMAWRLLDNHLEQGIPVRLIGFGVEDFYDGPIADEDLFSSPHPRQRQEQLSRTLDALRERYKDQI